jgi:hypothetical protein
MHVSGATLFALLGWRTNRILGTALSVNVGLVLIATVFLGWHYLDFPHFYPSSRQVITQKISSWAMKRSASSIDSTVRPNGPVEAHRSFQSDQ